MNRVRATSLMVLGLLGLHTAAEETGWRPPVNLKVSPVAIPLPSATPELPGWTKSAQKGEAVPATSGPPQSLFTPIPVVDSTPPESLFRPVQAPEVKEPPVTGLFLNAKPDQGKVLPGEKLPVRTLDLPAPPPAKSLVTIPAIPGPGETPWAVPAAPTKPTELPSPIRITLPGIPAEAPAQLPELPKPTEPKPATEPVNPFREVPSLNPSPAPIRQPEIPALPQPKAEKEAEPLPPPRPVPTQPDPKEGDPDRPPQKKPDPSEPLPLPKTQPQPIIPASGPVLEPLPSENPGTMHVPTRGHVFGSPGITLSREGTWRDNIGLNMLYDTRLSGLFRNLEPDGPPSTFSFLQAEYLSWWVNPGRIPVLASTGTPQSGGFLGLPDTEVLLGPGTFGPTRRDGFRVRGGTYFDDCTGWGIDGSFFFLGRASETFVANSDQFPVLTRPFFSQNAQLEFGEIVAFPGLSRGVLEISNDSFLWGADLNVRKALCRTCQGERGWLAGYRHLNLTENLIMTEFITAAGALAPDPLGTRITVRDRFQTQNQFHGAQVGGFWGHRYGRLDVDARASVAMGITHQIISIDGTQERTRPGESTQLFRGGLLATGTNLGRFTSNRFSVVPEATINVGLTIAPGIRTYVGYNYLFWSNVVRPGDQIDRVLDETLIPNPRIGVVPAGQNRPAVPFRQSSLGIHGIQFGLELRW